MLDRLQGTHNNRSMAASSVELDFFRLEKESSSAAAKFHRRRSFRDIQSVISKLNPDVLKSVIATGDLSAKSSTLLASDLSISTSPPNPGSAPLTIFYNGTVAVFDVPSHKAEKIFKFAGGGEEDLKLAADRSNLKDQEQQLLDTIRTISGGGGDLPMARKKSLQRFMLKRQQRSVTACPYTFAA